MSEEFYTATFGNGVQVDHPTDLRKKKVYHLPRMPLTEEEAIEVAKTILVITGTKDITEQAKKPEQPRRTAKELVNLCPNCKTTPCDMKGPTTLICSRYTTTEKNVAVPTPEVGFVYGDEGQRGICSACKTTPCPNLNARGKTPIIECTSYKAGGG